jgi:hypothetical protein
VHATRLPRILPLLLLYLPLQLPALAQQDVAPPAAATPAPAEDPELQEIVVHAPEPRYVAPTTRDRIGRVWVPVYLNDKGPFRLVLDSGATRTALVPSVVDALQLPTGATPPVLLRGVTGEAVTPTVRLQRITVGDLQVGPSTVPIVADAFGGAEGLLGTEGMRDKRIFIDFRNDFINISRSQNRRAAPGFRTVPFLRDELQLLVVWATIGNRQVRAIIDTGAQASVGNMALHGLLTPLTRRGQRAKDVVTGATGDTQTGIGVRIANISVGSLVIREAHITFGDMRIFEHWNMIEEPAIVIGMDILGLLDTLVIDYQRMEMQIKPRNRPS